MSMQDIESNDGIFFVLNADVQRLFEENSISIGDILAQAQLKPADAREISNPAPPPEGAREVVTVILASAAAVAVLTPLITRVIRLYTHRPVLVEDTELVPVLDGNGKPLLQANGEPVLVWQRKKRLVEPQQPPEPAAKAAVVAPGFEISLG
jgi:hypothetical protein